MQQIDTNSIRETAEWLKHQSVSSDGTVDAHVTKQDLEKLRNNVAEAITSIADILDG